MGRWSMPGRRRIQVVLGYGLLAVLALSGGGGAAVLIGGAGAAGGAAGYAYYKGDVSLDFPAEFNQTWTASLAALPDLDMPILQQSLTGDYGEMQTRSRDGERLTLYLESVQGVNGAPPQSRVHIRVGIFGHQVISQQIL